MGYEKIEVITEYTDQPVQNKLLLADRFYDIKYMSIPKVRKTLIKQVIINALKKSFPSVPEEDAVDYQLLAEENKKLHLVVFIRYAPFPESFGHSKIMTVYHYLCRLVQYDSFKKDVRFLIEEGATFFIYHFRDGTFKKRMIYYTEDLAMLHDAKIYYLRLQNNLFVSGDGERGFLPVPDEIIAAGYRIEGKAIFCLEKGRKERWILDAAIFICLAVCCCFSLLLHGTYEKERQLREINYAHETELAALKKKNDLPDAVLKRYMKLYRNRSAVNPLWYSIYAVAHDNLQIQTIGIHAKRFTLSGSCKSDADLERNFRSLHCWKYISFTFTKSKGETNCTIEGEFINEN